MRTYRIGTGQLGLVTGACLAENGNDVWCVDVDPGKVARFQMGQVPIYGPGLEEIVKRNVAQGRAGFTTDLEGGAGNRLRKRAGLTDCPSN